MSMDFPHTLESVKEGTKEIAETAHVKTDEFHEKYVSKVLPDCGKYGDAAKFAAEMIPGVAEYNAVKDGDWQAFAIAAGIDIASLAAGAVSAGTGYAAVKGSSKVAGGFLKKAGREVAEAGVKKAAKEFAEAGTEKAVKELAAAGAEKAVKEVAEAGTEKAAKEVAKSGVVKAEEFILKVGDKIDKTHFPEYIEQIEEITKREILPKQKELINKALKENDFSKLDKDAQKLLNREYNRLKASLIEEWERQTGNKWPRYTKDVLDDKTRAVIREAGQPFDVHHIIERSVGGPNEWWNITPARFPDEHQRAIHGADSWARKIFGK